MVDGVILALHMYGQIMTWFLEIDEVIRAAGCSGFVFLLALMSIMDWNVQGSQMNLHSFATGSRWKISSIA